MTLKEDLIYIFGEMEEEGGKHLNSPIWEIPSVEITSPDTERELIN